MAIPITGTFKSGPKDQFIDAWFYIDGLTWSHQLD